MIDASMISTLINLGAFAVLIAYGWMVNKSQERREETARQDRIEREEAARAERVRREEATHAERVLREESAKVLWDQQEKRYRDIMDGVNAVLFEMIKNYAELSERTTGVLADLARQVERSGVSNVAALDKLDDKMTVHAERADSAIIQVLDLNGRLLQDHQEIMEKIMNGGGKSAR